ADFVAKAGQARLLLEEREGARLAAIEVDQAAARLREDQVVSAWKKWYAEAVLSVSRLVVGPASPALQARLPQLSARFVETTMSGVLPQRTTSDEDFQIVPASFDRPLNQGATILTKEVLELALDRLQGYRWYPAPDSIPGESIDKAYLPLALNSSDATL